MKNINIMKNFYRQVVLAVLVMMIHITSWAQPQVTVALQTTAGICLLHTNCDSARICMDIVMTVNINKTLDSYNIWVEYNGDVLSREQLAPNDNSGHGDNTCVLVNGNQDTDLEGPPFSPDHWRVTGVPGSGYAMTANVPKIVHTICFKVLQPGAITGQSVCAGGNVSGLLTTVTFSDGTSDTDVPKACLTLNETVVCSALPVELLNFDVTKNGHYSQLDWRTSTELNSDYFEIEKAGGDKIFSKVGRVESIGFTTSPTAYQFMDERPYAGTNYYRLKQVDNDGRFEYSPMRSLSFNDRTFNVRAWPNPVEDNLNIEIQGNHEDEPVELKLINAEGRIVLHQKIDGFQPYTTLDLNGFDPGIYTLMVESDQNHFVQKIVVVR